MVSDVVKWLTKWSPAHLSFSMQCTIHLNYLRSGKHTLYGIQHSCESFQKSSLHYVSWQHTVIFHLQHDTGFTPSPMWDIFEGGNINGENSFRPVCYCMYSHMELEDKSHTYRQTEHAQALSPSAQPLCKLKSETGGMARNCLSPITASVLYCPMLH